ncbi:nitroreductase family protein [Speluncibacter jeojiensis]|uniref:nitroreductase family protein n=1 Tax=Speluncibacter jeojiensis TaxID=2710754 RepID=UPI00240F6E35|nr:nitroreductase family protein [Rhodococcus sp. D2-41]
MSANPNRPADPNVELHPLIAARWSPRNLDPTAGVSEAELLSALEAGRVAASWGGTFPVRFVAGMRGDETFTALTDLLTEGNRAWAHAAGALVLGAAQSRNAKGDLEYAMFDLGLATAQVSLQAVAHGMVAHPMAGFDADAARTQFAIPDEFRPAVVIALGHLGAGEHPDEAIRESDARPRRRPALAEMAFAGTWGRPFGAAPRE